MKKGSKMPMEARAKISASLQGNQYRSGIPHTNEIKLQISESLKRAYIEGRHEFCPVPENLAQFNADVRAGKRPHPRRNPDRDRGIVKSYFRYGSAAQAADEWGITQSAVYYALARSGARPIRKGRQ